MEDNPQRQRDEVSAMLEMYAGTDQISMLSSHFDDTCKAEEWQLMGPVCFRVRLQCNGEALSTCWSLHVSLPLGYPTDQLPVFRVEAPPNLRSASTTLEEQLAVLAAEKQGEECIYDAVMRLEELVAEIGVDPPLPDAVITHAEEADGAQYCRTLLRIDHMNDPRGYTRHLESWAREGGLQLSLFYRSAAQGRYRHIHLVLDGPARACGAFVRNLRTQAVDVDGRGEPCKERCAELLEQFALDRPVCPGFSFTINEYGAADELDAILNRARAGFQDPCVPATPGTSLPASGRAWCTAAKGGGTLLHVAVRPGRRAMELTNVSELRRMPETPAVCVDLHAQAREGEANSELVKFLASHLHLASSNIYLVGGGKAREKQLKVDTLDPDEVARRLLAA